MHNESEINELSREEKLLKFLKTSSLRQVLIDAAGGAQLSNVDLQLIESIMFKQQLPPEVIDKVKTIKKMTIMGGHFFVRNYLVS